MRPYPRDNNRSTGDEVFFEPPIRGLRTDSSLIGLSPGYAFELDNMVVQPDGLVTRRGVSAWATGVTGTLPTLLAYNSGTQSKLFVKSSAGVFDVSAAGAVGAAVHAGTAGDSSYVNFGTSGGQFLLAVNGVDDPILYNGTAWTDLDGASTPAMTGATTSNLQQVCVYRQRLFFTAVGALGFYYLPVDSVAGALTLFRIGSICSKGGYAVAQATRTVDGGEGQDDYYAIATSEGQVAIFFGNDPGNLSAWDLRGVYDLGRPISKHCFLKFGGDLLYLSEDGVVPMSAALITDKVNKYQYLSKDIAPSIQQDISRFRASYGWTMLTVPDRALLIVNVPSSPPKQYVYQTQSRAWSTFSGWDALSWATYGGVPYFVDSAGTVQQAFATAGDNGGLIRWKVRTAFNRFKKMRQIRPILVRPFIAQDTPSTYFLGMAADFQESYFGSQILGAGGSAGLWDSGLWDVALWGGGFRLQNQWRTLPTVDGVAVSMEVSGASQLGATVFLGADLKLSEHGLVF